jgi:hypothetical protein
VQVDDIGTNEFGGYWQPVWEMNLHGLLPATDQMRVHFLVEDELESDNVIKAAIDKVLVYDAMSSATNDADRNVEVLTIYPNPANGRVFVEYDSGVNADRVEVYNVFGQKVYDRDVRTNPVIIDMTSFGGSGIYVVRLVREMEIVGVGKIILE